MRRSGIIVILLSAAAFLAQPQFAQAQVWCGPYFNYRAPNSYANYPYSYAQPAFLPRPVHYPPPYLNSHEHSHPSRQLIRQTQHWHTDYRNTPPVVGGIPVAAENNNIQEKPSKNRKDDKEDECEECKINEPPEAIFEWAIGHNPFEFDEEGNGNGNGNGEQQEEKPLVTDRPDFTESSKSVGRGRIQVEMGYLFVEDRERGEHTREHSYPNMLIRLGMFTDWFELRIGHTFTDQRTLAGGMRTNANGAEDLLLAFRFDLTEQKGWLPESSLVYNMLLPVGSDEFTADEILVGVALWYSWELIPDKLSLAGGSLVNRARDDSGEFFMEFSQSFSLGVSLAEKVGSYVEWFGIIPSGAIDSGVGPAHSIDGGFTYQPANNLQLDIFAGFGISRDAPDFFAGSGLVVRY